ncbi:MAG: S8 family serine peptidase [Actinobacteria bacterium]|nr:S8 family serine peptidase [Actinomycetota bacterium]
MRHDPMLGDTTPRARSLRLLAGTALALVALVGLPLDAAAGTGADLEAFVPPSLLEAARADGDETFDVIVQGVRGKSSEGVATEVLRQRADRSKSPHRFASVAGVQTELTGAELLRLARKKSILAITPNAPVRLSGLGELPNSQLWPYVSGVAKFWWPALTGTLRPPAIAIVDSGVDAARADLRGRVLEQVTLTSLPGNSPGDGRGHGMFVASIAAGAASGYIGAAPSAPLVSLDVADDAGKAMTADVIRAADWILANKDRLGIRVANFSLHASNPVVHVRPAQQGHRAAVVRRRGRRGGSGKLRRPGARRPVRAGQRSVRDHRRRKRQQRLLRHHRRLRGTLVGVGLHARRLREARARRARPAHRRRGLPWGVARSRAPGEHCRAWLHAALRHFVRGADGGRRSGDTPRAAPELDARPGQGCPHGDREGHAGGDADGARRRRDRHRAGGRPRRSSEPERRPQPVPRPGPAHGRRPLRRGELDERGRARGIVDERIVGLRAWTSASWTSASWTSASWTSASWTSASWTSASWTSASWTSASWTSTSESDASWLSNAESDSGSAPLVATDELAAAELELGLDLNGDGVVGVFVLLPGPSLP